MKIARLAVLAFICAVVFFASNSQSQAQGLGRAQFHAGLYGAYGWHDSLYARGYVPIPPYFALHPPVYYGERYTRPYGASPFAAKSQLQQNDNYRHRIRTDFVPMKIDNPYCPTCKVNPTPAKAKINSRTAAAPQMIENPYYKAGRSSVTQAKLANASP